MNLYIGEEQFFDFRRVHQRFQKECYPLELGSIYTLNGDVIPDRLDKYSINSVFILMSGRACETIEIDSSTESLLKNKEVLFGNSLNLKLYIMNDRNIQQIPGEDFDRYKYFRGMRNQLCEIKCRHDQAEIHRLHSGADKERFPGKETFDLCCSTIIPLIQLFQIIITKNTMFCDWSKCTRQRMPKLSFNFVLS